MSNNRHWYALYTVSGYEKKVTGSLSRRRVEYYCPMNQAMDKVIDPKRKINQPLFPGFIFVRVTKNDHEPLKQLSGVLSLVHWQKEPAVFDNVAIEMIRQFLNVHITVKTQQIAVNKLDKVRVIGTTLTERGNGELSMNRKQVQLFLPSLGYILSAEVESYKADSITEKFTSQMKTLETAV